MSYNSGLGISGSRIPGNRDRDRERDRDRVRNRDRDRDRNKPSGSSKLPNNRDRGQRGHGSVSAFGPGLTSNSGPSENLDSGNYRRHEPQRDYYNYRGNYGRRPNSSYGQNNRKRDSYDKYRPSNKNKPGLNVLRNDSWDKRDRPEGSHSYGDRSSRGERSEYKPARASNPEEASANHDSRRLLYNRRLDSVEGTREHLDSTGRNNKVETASEKMRHSPSVALASSSRRASIAASEDSVKASTDSGMEVDKKSAVKEEEPKKSDAVPGKVSADTEEKKAEPEKAAEPKAQSADEQAKTDAPKNLDKSSKDEKLLHLFDDDDEPKPKEVEEEKVPDQKAAELKEQIEKPSSEANPPSTKNEEGQEKKATLNEESEKQEPEKVEEHDHLEEHEGEESEAETIITSEPISTDLAMKYVRKRGAEEERRRLKRKIIYSENESEDDEDSYRPTLSAQQEEHASDEDEKASPQAAEHKPKRAKRASDAGITSTKRAPDNDSAESSDAESDRERGEGKQASSRADGGQHSKPMKSYKMKRDSIGRSLLQRACKKGDLEAVKSFIARGADANESDFGGFTCLHEAALAGHTDIVKYLIKQGADVNRQALEAGDSETPLMDAAENKHIETVKVLLANGADPNITNVDGFSALTKLYHLQSEEDDYDEIIGLLNAAADNNLRSKDVSKSPRKVIEDPNESYFNDLIKKKSQLSTIYKYVAQGLKEAAAEDFILHGYSLQKKPDILILAARHGHTELVDILLGLNPGTFDINSKNRVGVSILLASVGRGNYEVVKLLLSRGADPLLTRDHDGLNALQISKHSAQHDPREVFLIEQHLSKTTEKSSPAPPSSPSPQDRVQEKEHTDNEREKAVDDVAEESRTKGGRGEASEAIRKRTPSADAEGRKMKKHKPSFTDIKLEPRDSERDRTEAEHQSTGSSILQVREKTPDPEQKSKLHRSASGASLSPGPSTKAQEEQKQKALEEAKIWQEKVEAKKRARREMFLQAEKEKERKRKEDEEKKIELEKQQKLKAQEEELKKAQEAEKLAKDLESKRRKLEIELIIEKYPIGLRHFIFGQRLSNGERLKFCPLYVFDISGQNYVVDLQISLLLAQPVSTIHEHCNKVEKKAIVLDTEAKSKIWPLFYPMVGIGRNHQVEQGSMSKFMCLQLTFLAYEDITNFVREQDLELYKDVWESKKEARVSMNLLPLIADASVAAKEDEISQNPSTEKKDGFVPPRWKFRQDVVRTIHSAHTPLW